MAKLTLSFKGRIIDQFDLQQGTTLIGRENECDILIDSLAVAPKHVRIIRNDDHCSVEAIDNAFRLLVNHEAKQSAGLSHGDLIQIGKHTLQYTEDAVRFVEPAEQPKPEPQKAEEETRTKPTSQPQPAPGGLLQIINGQNFGRIIPLKGSMTRIGHTGSECAIIVKRASGYFISLLEGAESPIVNQTPIGDTSIELKNGDIIQVGSTRLQFHDHNTRQANG